MFVACLLVGLTSHAQASKPEVTYLFNDQKAFPSDELIPPTTLVHFDGFVGNADRRFILIVNGETVGNAVFNHRFNFDLDVSKLQGDDAHCEIDYAIPGERSDLFAKFDLHLLRTKVQPFATDSSPDGGLNVKWNGALPRPGCYADVVFDGTDRGVIGPGGNVSIPRKIATPGMHSIRCVLHLPNNLQMQTAQVHVEVPSPAWLTAANGNTNWTISSGALEEMPRGELKLQTGIKATVKRLYVDHSPVLLDGQPADLKWRIPPDLIHEGQVSVTVELADETGERFTTAPLALDVAYDADYAAALNTKATLKLIDSQFPASLEFLSTMMGWRPIGHSEDLTFLRDGSLVIARKGGPFDEKVSTGDWNLFAKFTRQSIQNADLNLSPSLTTAKRDQLESLLIDHQAFLKKCAEFGSTQKWIRPFLPADNPWEGFPRTDALATNALSSRATLKSLIALAQQIKAKRDNLAASTKQPPLVLKGASVGELLKRWASVNLPRIAYLEWIRGVYSDSQVGASDEYPLLGHDRLKAFVEAHASSELTHVASVLSTAHLVQHWDLRGFSNEQGLTNTQGEELNRSRRLLGKAFGYLADASEILQTGTDGSGEAASVDSRLGQAADCIEQARSVAEGVRQEL